MFTMLLESRPRGGAPRWGIAIAFLLHATALAALLRPSARVTAAIVVLPPESFPPAEPTRLPQPGPMPSLPVSGLVIPTLPSPGPIPGVPEVPMPIGVPTAPEVAVHDSSVDLGNEPWSSALVQEPPVLLVTPLPLYPDLLRAAGIQGRVMIEAVVDTLGRVEHGSVRVVSSTHPDFDRQAVAVIRVALFRPARVLGRAVRVLVRVPVAFRLH